ncbi:MAG: hypothetical protein ACOYLF_17985 [Blastocatellia bacterium]
MRRLSRRMRTTPALPASSRRLWRVRPVAGSNMRPRPIPWR